MRKPRGKDCGEGYYHLVSRCCLNAFLFGEEDKEMFTKIMRDAEAFCGVEVLAYCIVDNHFHILLHVPKPREISEEELLVRLASLYGEQRAKDTRVRWKNYRAGMQTSTLKQELTALRRRIGDISPFMKTLKEHFSRWYRTRHDYEGGIWQGRFSSTIVEGSPDALATVAAYIDLNPVRAGIAKEPTDYKWCGYGAALAGDEAARRGLARLFQSGAEASDFTDSVAANYRARFDLKGLGAFDKEKVRKILEKGGKLPLPLLLRCRVRHFTHGTFFGSPEFVNAEFEKHRDFFSKDRKTGARSISACSDWRGGTLCSARALQKAPVTL